MSETNMPAAEVNSTDGKDFISYEFAFHILPTVAEGEVQNVVEVLKKHITKAGGDIFDEEAPKRFDLAYDIVKYLEGKHRKFSSAYFGWIRFRVEPSSVTSLTEKLDETKEVLRYLLVKLTKIEEQTPFQFHESIADRKVRTVVDEESVEEVAEEVEEVMTDDLEAIEPIEVVADVESEDVEVADDSKEEKETV